MNYKNLEHSTENKKKIVLDVEFLILHYTATDLQNTLRIFQDPVIGVSSHLVIDIDGTIYSLVEAIGGIAYQAWHAGKSFHEQDNKEWEAFNDFSIGIELVNLNGNVFPYTDKQYTSLQMVVETLKKHYPSLRNPERVLGHEDISGFRGKVDPGLLFDWKRFWLNCYPDSKHLTRKHYCPVNLSEWAKSMSQFAPEETSEKSNYWQKINTALELALSISSTSSLK